MPTINARERKILRDLARQVRAIAEDPSMPDRRQRWIDHNGLRPQRPLVLCFPEGAWQELLPPSELQCTDPPLRAWERRFRTQIYWWNHIRDDHVVQPTFDVPWKINIGDFGVPISKHRIEDRGSYIWDPPLKDLPADLDKLHFRELSVDRTATEQTVNLARELFDDILPVRLRSGTGWSLGMTWEAIDLVGMEPFYMAMHDQPDAVHRLMQFLHDDRLHYIKWLEAEGLLGDQNEAEYVGSGGVAFTDELPQPDRKPGDPVRLIDRWGFAESQETVGVSPEMFAEFILPYQADLLQHFGLNCYGCCEPVHDRLDDLMAKIPRLRRVSCSPWVDQRIAKEKLGDRIIFSRKPNPTQICVMFDEDAIRKDLRTTLEIAGSGPLEIIMKDTHTVQNQPHRITRWVELALEEVDRYMLHAAKV